jgi:hypothetical protein
VKSRKLMPDRLEEDALRQVEASAKDGQLPAAVLLQDRRPHPESLVVVRPEAFARGVFGAQTGSVSTSGPPLAARGERYALPEPGHETEHVEGFVTVSSRLGGESCGSRAPTCRG